MIPQFPIFKNLELDDRKQIESIANNFPPYSDFNLTSLWIWDVHHTMKVSQLNENIVILFNDYLSNRLFLSFIGSKRLQETASQLLDFSKENYQTDFLRLVPEEVARALPSSQFSIISDKDSYDYIYFIPDLAMMDILWKEGLSKNIKQFLKIHPTYQVSEHRVQEAPKTECEHLFIKWANNKQIENCFDTNEYKAFQRLFQLTDDNIRVICLRLHNVLAGFTVYEIMPNDFVISHFAKSDVERHRAINDILNWEEAKNLEAKGLKHFNWEQDLGIPGLRQSKEKYRPCFWLEKFTVKFATEA